MNAARNCWWRWRRAACHGKTKGLASFKILALVGKRSDPCGWLYLTRAGVDGVHNLFAAAGKRKPR